MISMRYPQPDTQNYRCADATWHTLLTMKAYQETPVEIHKFLPIVTLGQAEDKGISWGATIPDTYGNYYYTSFSPLGYIVPYLFVHLFRLPINEQSLYLFNSILYLLCFGLTVKLLLKLFADTLPKPFIILIASLYLFQPEILHSQGIVYWHQSLFSFVFLLQLNLFIHLQGKWRYIVFFLLCLIAPYLEWTGYISNIGFAIAFFFHKGIVFRKSEITLKTERVVQFLSVLICTFISGVLFVAHYLSVVSAKDFIRASIARFWARVSVNLFSLMLGYVYSFGLLLCVVIVLLVITVSIKKYRVHFWHLVKDNGGIIFVTLFALLENIVMMQHATQYTFDRMKGIFPVLIIICCCMAAVWKTIDRKAFQRTIAGCAAAIVLILNTINSVIYAGDNTYWKWNVSYLKTNHAIAKELTAQYTKANSIYVQEKTSVQGYANLLFGRGIYEFTDIDTAKQIAAVKGKRYIVSLQNEGKAWNMYDYNQYRIYDTATGAFIK